jgi:uncharacterized protein YbjT (DUF2867 family)
MFVVAGATGKVGSVVADRLLDANKPVRAIVRDRAKAGRLASRGADIAVGDLGDAAFLAGVLRRTSGFFTLIPPDYTALDLFASQRRIADAVASAVRDSGVPHVVLLSSMGAELPTGTGPIKGLRYFEERLGDTGTTLTALRAAYFQENAASALVPARRDGIFPNFGHRDDQPIAMVATRDVGEQAARSLMDPPRSSEVISLAGASYTARDVASSLGAALGKRLTVVNIPQTQWVSTLRDAGLSQSGAEALAEMYVALAQGLIVPRGDRIIGATTPIEETMRALAAS